MGENERQRTHGVWGRAPVYKENERELRATPSPVSYFPWSEAG